MGAIAPNVLHYELISEGSSELQLRESDGIVRVIFSVLPMWLYALGIGSLAFCALLYPVMLIFSAKSMLWVLSQVPALRSLFLLTVFVHLGGAVFQGAIAMAHGKQLYRRGRMPRTLTATPAGLTLSYMHTFAPRSRFWPAHQIASIELLILKDIFAPHQRVGLLKIRRRNRWFGLRYRLKTTDPAVPAQIAERLAAMLECPVRIRVAPERSAAPLIDSTGDRDRRGASPT